MDSKWMKFKMCIRDRATPAQIAGCKEIVLCTPPDKEGKVHPAILYAAKLAGVNKIFKAGGVQAIAAMAYGTESVPKVYKIFGQMCIRDRGIVNVFRMFLFVLLVLSESQFKMKYPFYYARPVSYTHLDVYKRQV